MICIGPTNNGKVESGLVPSGNSGVLNTGKRLNKVNPIDTTYQIIFPLGANRTNAKKINAPIITGIKDEKVTGIIKPGGMVAPSALAIKLQILLRPAPINPEIAPPLRACVMVGFCVSICFSFEFRFRI